tara:strand:+ start:450 stop:1490 length:1041 start_codon:yes stop_codon:yes gene_type:complete
MTLFLANPNSFHLATWAQIYGELNMSDLDLATIHGFANTTLEFDSITSVTARPKSLAYVLIGLRLRIAKVAWIHAHGASGYGLAARISGKPYVVTVYGSEVLARHGLLYRRMMRAILRGARAITVTSDVTRDVIARDFAVPKGRIHSFHTGIDTNALDVLEKGVRIEIPGDRKLVFSIRNSSPTYRTQEIIEACTKLVERGYAIDLIVPLGNGDPAYFQALQNRYPQPWIRFIGQRLENREMLAWMQQADVCISYPVTDQVSTSILEALYVGRMVVVGWLDAYTKLLDEVGEDRNLIFARDDGLLQAIETALSGQDRQPSAPIVRAKYSVSKAALHQAKVLELFND